MYIRNAIEYERELRKLRQKSIEEFVIRYRTTRPDHDGMVVLLKNCLKPVEDFENRHQKEPIYVIKKYRRYYHAKFIEEHPHLWISDKPVNGQRFLINSPWIIELTFDPHHIAIRTCKCCNETFVRFFPNQKYCPVCRYDFKGTELKKSEQNRTCQFCSKPISPTAHGKRKFCSGACRTADCRERKEKDNI